MSTSDPSDESAFFRFERSAVATSPLKGQTADYEIRSRDGSLLFTCQTVGGGITRPTVLLDAGGEAVATLKARRRILNRAYDLLDAKGRSPVGKIHTKLGASWRVEIPEGSPRFEIMDLEKAAKASLRDALGGAPDTYIVLEQARAIGRVERVERPAATTGDQDRPVGFLRKALGSVLKVFDWTLLLEEPLDARSSQALIAATLLLQEHTIQHHRSSV